MQRDTTQDAEARWEAGEIGCGRLVMGLSKALSKLNSGERLELVTLDAGAPIDVPAWCRMTGHQLVSWNRPSYVIRKIGEKNV